MSYRLGIDLGGMSVKTGIVGDGYSILSFSQDPVSMGLDSVVRSIKTSVRNALGKAGLKASDIEFCGLGAPGFFNPVSGNLVFSANLGLREVPLSRILSKEIMIPVKAGNDANCAVIGETLNGGARGRKDVVMITIGTGIGGGILLNRQLFTGGNGMGGEVGHTPLISGGEKCSCGIRGCFEAYASATALIRQTEKAIAEHPESLMCKWKEEHGRVSGRTSFECARIGDETALKVVDCFEEYVAAGLGGLITLFKPEICLIGGGISAQGEFLLNPIREKIGKYIFACSETGAPEIQAAVLGNDAGIIGAAFLDSMS